MMHRSLVYRLCLVYVRGAKLVIEQQDLIGYLIRIESISTYQCKDKSRSH